MTQNPGNDDDGYFNDLSRQPHSGSRGSDSPQEQCGPGMNGEDEGAPKTKRIACVICRKRKLKCDGNKPKCATCARLGHNCAYDEVRRKSGPKRGYVKELEARLAQVETQLSSKDPEKAKLTEPKHTRDTPKQSNVPPTMFHHDSMGTQADLQQSMPEATFDPIPTTDDPLMIPITNTMPDLGLGLDDSFSWEMIGLGLEEPMPMQEAIDELTQVYFDKVHPTLPMIHRYRYQTSMSFNPERRPPICLRYIMWCHAAVITDKYMHHHEIFYRRARKYMELDEMKGQGEAFVSLGHAQCWTLIAAYEFKMMYFPRAWMSVGRACRMVLMMGLNRVDGVGLDVKQCLPPPRDWTEREERRRTFWTAYCVDRYASIGTGWPMTVDERDIMTYLPASEEAYESSTPQKTPTLAEAMKPQQVASLSSFAGVVFVSHFFGLNLTHLHRPSPNDREADVSGEFWKRHRNMDNVLLNTSLSLPSHLRLPAGVRNSNVVFLNFALHTSTICLHQAAIFKAEKFQLSNTIIEQSRTRCILAAAEIATVMRLTSHLDVAGMNPFMAFCLYVAARVFVQYLKTMPNDQEVRASLEFLLTAMQALQRKNPLTESFLVQLNLDIEGSGLDIFSDYSSRYTDGSQARLPPDLDKINNTRCTPVFHISDSSSEGRSADDLRFPKWDHNKDNPTAITESPRQTQYAFRSIDLAARSLGNTRQKRPYFPEYVIRPAAPAVFPGESLSEDATYGGPIGMSTLINNNINSSGFDTEMSDQTNQSTGLTPQSTNSFNHSSSNTSYSPPQVQDEDSSTSQAAQMPSMAGVNNHYTGFTPPSDNIFVRQGSTNSAMSPSNVSNQEDPFKMPPGWDLGVGATPGNSGLTGNTPDGGWEKLMEGMSGNWGSG